MNINTAVSLAKGGKLLVLLGLKSLFTHFYRLSFYASMADTAILEQLAKGPVRIESLNGGFSKSPALRDATEAWLGLGVHLGLLKKSNAGYSLRSFLAKKLADPQNDAIRALVREVAGLHHLYITQTPAKLEQGLLWDSAGPHSEYGDIIARSSRSLEPFLFELIDRFLTRSDAMRLLEVGCGYGGYIIYAAKRCKRLNAVGLELDEHVAQAARNNVETRGLGDRVKITVADVRDFRTDDLFDMVTLYNNIYYFHVEERVGLLKHLRSLLKPNGQLILTTGCANGGIEFELVNLIHSTTNGWGRLPDKDEMLRQFAEAGFVDNLATGLIPGNNYCAFTGYRPMDKPN